jgi:hypothetical protein
MEDGRTRISWMERNGGVASRGKKSGRRRCGKTSEAKPFSGQTFFIETADGA